MATAAFAREKTAMSLSDLPLVRKIVEREGCLEALGQMLSATASTRRNAGADAGFNRLQSRNRGADVTDTLLNEAPVVVQSLVEQLRSVSIQIVEDIAQWKRATHAHVFQWRGLNYQRKMLSDLDFLAVHVATLAHIDAFHGIRLQRNPFLTRWHLDHPACQEPTCELAMRVGTCGGNVDAHRVFDATRMLLEEERTQRIEQGNGQHDKRAPPHEPVEAVDSRASTSGQEDSTCAASRSVQSPSVPAEDEAIPDRTHKRVADDRVDAMEVDVHLARELLFHGEHELGALREEVAMTQHALADVVLPDQRRRLQMRITALNGEAQRRAGDVFHRRNELQRKEAVLRLAKRQLHAKERHAHMTMDMSESSEDGSTSSNPWPVLSEAFQAALQEDELRRQALLEKFTTLAKMNASMNAKTNGTALTLPKRGVHAASTKHATALLSPTKKTSLEALDEMSVEDVEMLINALDMGSMGCGYGALFRERGIDGHLLLQTTEQDLEELGVGLRLHRVKILEAIDARRG